MNARELCEKARQEIASHFPDFKVTKKGQNLKKISKNKDLTFEILFQASRHNYSCSAEFSVHFSIHSKSMAKANINNGFIYGGELESLIDRGKQIILAADRTPAQLGMGSDGFDDRITSRMSGGIVIGIESPSYEMKLNLIHVFCDRAFKERNSSLSADDMPEDIRRYMADKAGQSIRTLEGFCNRCVTGQIKAKESGKNIKQEEIDKIADTLWRRVSKTVNIEKVQEVVENVYGISHRDIVGNKRNKEIAEPRHVAIYLAHDLCQYTLVNIGKHFGGRKHATILHSIEVIEERIKEDKSFYDQISQLKKTILEQS